MMNPFHILFSFYIIILIFKNTKIIKNYLYKYKYFQYFKFKIFKINFRNHKINLNFKIKFL